MAEKTQMNPDEGQEFPPPPPGPPPASAQYQGSQTTQFPPPPPGPPPAHHPHAAIPDPAHPTHPVQPSAGLSAHGHYAPHPNEQPIPDYNPAEPYFAPPPSEPYEDLPSDEEGRHPKAKGWSQKLHHLGAKAAAPINSLANKMGSQAFLPATMDKECEKAAKILTSFCRDGVYAEQEPAAQNPPPTITPTDAKPVDDATRARPKSRGKVLVTIPQKVLANAVGLAIFTTARVGFHVSAATGSGVLVARLPDGTWSPPSGIQVHSLGAGFMVGLDIYDCVCVINSREALSAFMSTRVSLGSDIAVAAGPYGAGGAIDFGASSGPSKREEKTPENKEPATAAAATSIAPEAELAASAPAPADGDKTKLKADSKGHHRRSSSSVFKPVFSYVKSRGFYIGIQVDGTVITERKEANAAFYGQKVSADKILKGDVSIQTDPTLFPAGAKVLVDALRRAEETRPAPTAAAIPAASGVPPTGYAAGTDMMTGAVPDESQPPPYVDDGRPHPGVGDQKTTYG